MKKKYLLTFSLFLLLSGRLLAQDTLKLIFEPAAPRLLFNNQAVTGVIPVKNKQVMFVMQNVSGVDSPLVVFKSDNGERINLIPALVPLTGNTSRMIITTNGVLDGRTQLGSAVTITVAYDATHSFPVKFATDLPDASGPPPVKIINKDTSLVSAVGIPYYDALLLDSLSHTKNIESFINILEYYKKMDLIRDRNFILKILDQNEFLKEHLEKHWDSMNVVAAKIVHKESTEFNGIAGSISGGVSAIGGINVTNIADGLAKFLVERMKSELSASFFDRFEKTLNEPKYEDLKILFPETWKLLASMDQDIYQYSSYVNNMRQAFARDMANQYVNLEKLLNQPKYKDYLLRDHPELGSVLYSSVYIIKGISSGKHPGDVLKDFNVKNNIHLKDTIAQTDVRNAITMAQLISASVRSLSASHYWVPADSIRRMVENETTFKLYLGLMYEISDSVYFVLSNREDTVTLRHVLNNLYTTIRHVDQARDSLNEFRNYIEAFSDHADAVNEYLQIIRDKKKPDVDYNDYYRLFNTFLDMVEQSVTFTSLPYVDLGPKIEGEIKTVSDKWIYVARSSADLYVDVRTKNYMSALQNTLMILDTLLNYNSVAMLEELKQHGSILKDALKTELEQKIKQGEQDKRLISKRDVRRILNTLEEIDFNEYANRTITPEMVRQVLKEKIDGIKDTGVYTSHKIAMMVRLVESKQLLFEAKIRDRLRQYTVKYGAFIAAVAEAQSSDEVQEAIEAAVLPPGSARVKRETNANIAVNGYVGFFAGYEHINNVDHDGVRQVNFNLNKWNSYGVAAPVGLSFSLGKRNPIPLVGAFCKGNSSHSLFISVIDIGALAAFRMSGSNDSVSQVPDVQLKDIVSPGIFYSIGLPKCPVSVNLGYQVGPLLREVGSSVNVFGQGYSRFSISVCVDIPMFNLYTSTR
jgi:hypothetical protein